MRWASLPSFMRFHLFVGFQSLLMLRRAFQIFWLWPTLRQSTAKRQKQEVIRFRWQWWSESAQWQTVCLHLDSDGLWMSSWWWGQVICRRGQLWVWWDKSASLEEEQNEAEDGGEGGSSEIWHVSKKDGGAGRRKAGSRGELRQSEGEEQAKISAWREKEASSGGETWHVCRRDCCRLWEVDRYSLGPTPTRRQAEGRFGWRRRMRHWMKAGSDLGSGSGADAEAAGRRTDWRQVRAQKTSRHKEERGVIIV